MSDDDNLQYEEEEEEEYTTIYRKTKRTKSTRRRQRPQKAAKDIVKTEIKLNPFLVGAPVRHSCRPAVPTGPRTPDLVQQLVKDTLNEHKGSDIPALQSRKTRLFLGEFDSDDDDDTDGNDTMHGRDRGATPENANSEVRHETVQAENTRVWRFRKTGRHGLDRFRRVVEFVILAQQIFTTRRSVSLSRRDSILFFMDTEIKRRESKEVTVPQFNVNEFKSLGQKTKTASVKTCLQVPSCDRTDGQINHMVHVLRGFSKFSNYPRVVQAGICKQGWYARFEASKVLVKEGSRAEFYYLILSGEAVYRDINTSMESLQKTQSSMTASYLRPGDALGEKEILTNMERPATVVCKEPVEVLGLDRDTLLDIFKAAGGLASIAFLRSIPELMDFPLDLLQTYHFSLSAHYYRRGAVIVKNSNDSEWVYIVRSGSCQVYQAVRDDPQKSRGTNGTHQSGYVPAHSKDRLNLILPMISHVKQDTNKLKSASTNNMKDPSDKMRTTYRKSHVTLERSQTMFPQLNTGQTSLLQSSSDNSSLVHKSSPPLQTPRIATLHKSVTPEDSSTGRRSKHSSQKVLRKRSNEGIDSFRMSRTNTLVCESESRINSRLGQSPSESLFRVNTRKKGSNSSESDSNGNSSHVRQRVCSDSDVQPNDFSNKHRPGSKDSNDSMDISSSLFYVKLGVLTEKCVFGLHQLVYDNMPNLSLVSNGVECVLVSKQFLKDHLTDTIHSRLRTKLPKFPNLDQLRNAVDDQVNWGHYRDKLLNDIMK